MIFHCQEESTSKVDLYTTPSQEDIKTPVPLPKDTLKNRCSNPKSIHDNRADLQVSVQIYWLWNTVSYLELAVEIKDKMIQGLVVFPFESR